MKKTIFVLTLLMATTLMGCRIEKVNLGQDTTWTADNARGFHELSIAYPAEVTYTPSDSFRVTISGKEGMKERLDIAVADGRLTIGEQRGWKSPTQPEVKVHIEAPILDAVRIMGSGSFDCKETLRAPSLYLLIAGSGDMDIRNVEARELQADISGSGDMKVGATRVAQSDLTIAGSGDMDFSFHLCGKASVDIAGSGNVELKGNVETLEQNIVGSGNIDTSELHINRK